MDEKEGKICIWVPAYNEQAYIATTLRSILSQTYKNFDLVVSENHSTDETGRIAAALAQHDERVKIISPPKHLDGFAHGKFCIDYLSKLPYTAYVYLGAHDVMPPNYIECLVNAYHKSRVKYANFSQQVSVVFGKAVAVTEDGRVLSEYVRNPPETIVSGYFTALGILTSNFYNTAVSGLWGGDVFRRCIPKYRVEGADLFNLAESSNYGLLIKAEDAFFFARQAGGYGDVAMSYKKHLGSEINEVTIKDSLSNQCKWLRLICEGATRGFDRDVAEVMWDTYLRGYLTYRLVRDFRGQLPEAPFDGVLRLLCLERLADIKDMLSLDK